MTRRRASRNAARVVFMELAGIARPLERAVRGLAAWEPPQVVRVAWDDQANQVALTDAMSLDALLDVDNAYRQLAAVEKRLSDEKVRPVIGPSFLDYLSAGNWKLAERLLAEHVRPGIERLNEAVALLETLELAEEGRLEAEAARIQAKKGEPSADPSAPPEPPDAGDDPVDQK